MYPGYLGFQKGMVRSLKKGTCLQKRAHPKVKLILWDFLGQTWLLVTSLIEG
jgi:hypothetical protein